MKKIFLEDPGKYLDEKIKRNLVNLKKNYMDRDQDWLGLIVGDGTGLGVGKSTLEHLLCANMDVLCHGKDLRTFHTGRVFFSNSDYRMEKPNLKPLDSFCWDEPDAFLSTTGASRKSRKLKLDLIHIRQQRHFMMICADNVFTVGPWLRPSNTSRINAIFRCLKRRGVVYVYTLKTGSMLKIKADMRTKRIIWPAADLIFFFNPIPKTSEWWKDYIKRKNAHLSKSSMDEKVTKLTLKREKNLKNSLSIADMAEINKVNKETIRRWMKTGVFGKRGVYKDLNGEWRITMKAYKSGMKRLFKLKQKVRRGRPRKKKNNKK